VSQNPVGFGADLKGKKSKSREKILQQVEPDDLLKYGLIPEFIGRLPVTATLDPLDETALLNILTQPRNAIVKQYQKLFSLEGVELELEENALKVVVDKAMERGTGARALRSIIEAVMLDVMYHLPHEAMFRSASLPKIQFSKRKTDLPLRGTKVGINSFDKLLSDILSTPVGLSLRALCFFRQHNPLYTAFCIGK